MPLRHVQAAARAREREIHLEKLHRIEHKTASAAPWRAAPVPKPLPRPPSHGPRAASRTMASHEARLEQASHARRMQALVDRTARKNQLHLEHALTSGRATLSGTSARRKVQNEIIRENVILQRHIRNAKPKLASPSDIALLKGGGATNPGDGDGDDSDADDADGAS